MAMFKDTREEAKPLSNAEPPAEQPEKRSRLRSAMRLNLARGADGRIRAGGSTDIGDMWAEQQRIRLHEAILEDKKKAEKKKRGRRRLVGVRKEDSTTPPKEVIVTLSVPRVKLPRLPRKLPFVITRKRVIVGGILVVLFIASFSLYPTPATEEKQTDGAAKNKGASGQIRKDQRPTYTTILPKGKTIEQLGGWARISPPDKEPVFAYADTITDIPVTVSQQPLPASFKSDTAGKLADLAKQFNAQEKLTAGATTAYLGTSIKGPQSVVFAKNNLLILMKSPSKVENQHWVNYIDSLQ